MKSFRVILRARPRSYSSPPCRCERPSASRSKRPARWSAFPACSGSARPARSECGTPAGPPCSPSSGVPGCAAERRTSPPGKRCPLPGWGRRHRSDSAPTLLPTWALKPAPTPAGLEERSPSRWPPGTPGLGSGRWSLLRLLTGRNWIFIKCKVDHVRSNQNTGFINIIL